MNKMIRMGAVAVLFVMALSSAPTVRGAEAPIEVSAKSACLIEADSGNVVFEKNADERLPMASTTKIMTALVAAERCDLDKTVEVASGAVGIEGSSIYLKEKEQILMRDLLYALMLESANDAAAAIAYEAAGSIEAFADMMNETAERLGLKSTHFTNPHGLDDEEHYTTASDLATLAAEALKNPTVRQIVSSQKKTIPMADGSGTRLLVNHNKLLRTYDGAIGMKTGFTKRSGRCLVSAAERDGVTLIAVTLSAPNDWSDHEKMLDYGFEHLERVTPAEVGKLCHDLPIVGGVESTVRLTNRDRASFVLPKDTRVTVRIEADRFVPAPVNEGDALAKAVFYAHGEELAQIPLYADRSVSPKDGKPGFFERILHLLGR